MEGIGVCGHFAVGKEFNDGQTVKTRIIYDELTSLLGNTKIEKLDTYNWKKKPLRLLGGAIILAKTSDHILILPAHNGLKVILPLFVLLKIIFRFKLHYIVVGGWLPEVVENKKWLKWILKSITGIHVETISMRNKLPAELQANTFILPNIKRLQVIEEGELVTDSSMPYKLCTFSRVMKEKGIEDAINAVIKVNQQSDGQGLLCTLDIYGQVDPSYQLTFEELLQTVPDYIKYKGIINYNDSVNIVRNYHMLIFPTYYKGEGFPGTIIDAFCSGVPVIASDWKYNQEIITNNSTGLLFQCRDVDDLSQKIRIALNFPSQKIISMKKECLKISRHYQPDKVMGNFINNFLLK